MWKHRRKNVRGEAVQFTADGKNDNIISSWLGLHPRRVNEVNAVTVLVPGVGNRRVNRGKDDFPGDWIIRAHDGLYACLAESFAEAYELEPEPEIEKPEIKKPVPKKGGKW